MDRRRLAGMRRFRPARRRRSILEPRGDLRDDVISAHHVGFGAFELTDLKTNGDAAVDARLREIDTAVGVDGFDQR